MHPKGGLCYGDALVFMTTVFPSSRVCVSASVQFYCLCRCSLASSVGCRIVQCAAKRLTLQDFRFKPKVTSEFCKYVFSPVDRMNHQCEVYWLLHDSVPSSWSHLSTRWMPFPFAGFVSKTLFFLICDFTLSRPQWR